MAEKEKDPTPGELVGRARQAEPELKYRLKPGCHHGKNKEFGHDPVKNPKGPNIVLRKREAIPIMHKLEDQIGAMVLDVRAAQADKAKADNNLKQAKAAEAKVKATAQAKKAGAK